MKTDNQITVHFNKGLWLSVLGTALGLTLNNRAVPLKKGENTIKVKNNDGLQLQLGHVKSAIVHVTDGASYDIELSTLMRAFQLVIFIPMFAFIICINHLGSTFNVVIAFVTYVVFMFSFVWYLKKNVDSHMRIKKQP